MTNSLNWFKIPRSCKILSQLSNLYGENGALQQRDIAIWVKRRLLVAFFVPVFVPLMSGRIRKVCFGGMGSLQDVQLSNAAADDKMQALLKELYRLFS